MISGGKLSVKPSDREDAKRGSKETRDSGKSTTKKKKKRNGSAGAARQTRWKRANDKRGGRKENKEKGREKRGKEDLVQVPLGGRLMNYK